MKRLIVFLAVITLSGALSAQSLTPVENGSRVHFVIDNFGIGTGGDFKGLTGTITFDPSNLSTASFDVSVDASTINTSIASRDSHLRRAEYFDVANYPKLSFKSSKVTKTNKDGYYYMFGSMTIKSTTKEIRFPFTATPKGDGFLFEGTFKLNRRDYGVGGNSISLSDDVTITLSILANKGQ